MIIKNRLVRKLEEEKREKEEQEKLKEKYNIDEDIKIVEKNNTIKFILKLLVNGIKLICSITIIFLAFLGLISLIEPRMRYILIEIYNGILFELGMLLN